MPGCGCSIHDPSTDCGDTDSLHQGLSDCLLQLLCLVLGEELVDVDDESLVDLINELVVSGVDLDVRVVCEGGVDLSHVLLNDCSSRHCVVDGLEVSVDCLRCYLLSEPSLDCLVGGVESDEDCPPDVVPCLLDSSVVDTVQVICLCVDVSVGQLVGHPGPLSEGNSDVLVEHGDSTLLGDCLCCLLELDFGLGLFPSTKAVVFGGDVSGFLFELLLTCIHE